MLYNDKKQKGENTHRFFAFVWHGFVCTCCPPCTRHTL